MISVSVVIPTKDRSSVVGDAVRSVFAGTYQEFEVLVIDQSADNATRDELAPFASDSRFRYVRNRLGWPGAASSRNIGIALSAGDVIAHIDDDVTVRSDWMEALVAHFEADPALQFIAGKLSAPPCDATSGFIPVSDPEMERPPVNKWTIAIHSAGANYAMRRALFDYVGGYDNSFGPGTRFPGGDDTSMALRISRSGAQWKACSNVDVEHTHGFRSSEDAAALLKGYMVGIGAAFGREARRGDLLAGLWFLRTQVHDVLTVVIPNVLRGRRPTRFGWVRDCLVGLWLGFALPPNDGFVSGDDLRRMCQDLHERGAVISMS